MAQRFGFDTLGKITKLNNFIIQMGASTIQLGGKSYTSSSLNLDIRTTGLNGIDTASVEANTLYNLFAILNSNQIKLIASKLNSPTGYSVFKLLGKFRTDSDSFINLLVTDYLDNSNENLVSKTTISNNLNLSLRDFISSSKKSRDSITKDSSLMVKVLNSPNESASDFFGSSISISGDYLVVSSYNDDGSTELINSAGEVYIFKKDQGGINNWGLIKTLNSPNQTTGDSFGYSVALSGDYLVVSAYFDDGSTEAITDAGEAYVFKKNQGGVDNWGLIKTLNSPNESVSDNFGYSAAIFGDYIAVGADRDNGSTESIIDAGEVYVFKKDQGGTDNWGLIKTLNSPNETDSDFFGSSIAISGDYMVIGARGDNGISENSNNAGEAYVFKKDQGGIDNWGLIKQLNSPNENSGDFFGSSVAIFNDYIVVGAEIDAGFVEGVPGSGEAYVFKKDQGGIDNWGLIKQLNSPNESASDFFGSSVAISNDYIVVGASGDDGATESINSAGEVYVFKKDHGGIDNWGLIKVLNSSNESDADFFGSSIAILDDFIVVGARSDNGSTEIISSTGEAYVFKLNSSPINTSTGISWSSDNKILAVSHQTSPFVSLYEFTNDIFTQLSNPLSLPTGNANDCKFSNDSRLLAVAHETTPFISIYERNNLIFAKLANPSFLPTNSGLSCAWSPNSRFLAVGQLLTPFINLYEKIGNTFVKLPDPSTLPSGNGRDVEFSPNGRFLAVAHLSSPFITIYEIRGNSFVKLTNPTTLPTSNLFTLSWSPNGNYLAVAGNFTLVVYKVSGSTFTSIYSINPNDNCNKIFWSRDEKYFGLCLSSSPYIRFYNINNDVITPDASVVDSSLFSANSASWSSDNRFLAVAHSFSPYLNIYETSAEKPSVTGKNLKIVSRR